VLKDTKKIIVLVAASSFLREVGQEIVKKSGGKKSGGILFY